MIFKEKLGNTFKKHQIKITENQLEQFNFFYDYLIENNKIHNLTAITDEEEVIIKHFLDSILPIAEIKENSKVIDIGCGAGFPSIPLKIMNNNLQITAIDSVGKKVNFVQSAIEKLKLSDNFVTIHTRIEDLARKKEFRENFDYVISRAVAPLNIIIEYSAPFLKNNGYILSYKGSNYQEEIDNCKNALKLLNCNIEEVIEYNIEETQTKRYLLKIRKNGEISTKYPRNSNKPRTNPL